MDRAISSLLKRLEEKVALRERHLQELKEEVELANQVAAYRLRRIQKLEQELRESKR